LEFDAFTIVAQLLNFALILFVLQRFLYRPLIDAMDEREATIEARMQQAEDLEATADERAKEYATKLAELEDERTEQLAAVRETVDRENKRLHREMKERVEKLEADWRDTLKRDARSQLEHYRDDLGSELLATVRAALTDLASRDLEQELLTRFVELVDDLEEEVEKEFEAHGGALHVVTSRTLTEAEEERLEAALDKRFGDSKVTFDVDPALIAGIELRFAGHRLGWSIDDYLDTLESRMKRKLRDTEHIDLAAEHIDAAWNSEEQDAGTAAQ
jgi:F-type H+-transporting ATPase subunit b